MPGKLEQLSFDDAVKNLEKVVRSLELGEVPLEQALEMFQEGISLVKVCSDKLNEAEKKIQLLIEGPAGEVRLEPAISLEEGA
ncbi:MAG TPA: exodeoxyribonuclease VII small subunit [Candidatus Deferrimicrobium sp.]|jgi:exodeoxyribonuclease VII small subunit|nr:exodeoxyribonuclease VII small subunit [Candidatus Deferrimicrobium sp.]